MVDRIPHSQGDKLMERDWFIGGACFGIVLFIALHSIIDNVLERLK